MYNISALVMVTIFVSCNGKKTGDEDFAMHKDSLLRNISILSADSFQGRKPFTAGEKMTVNFLHDKFNEVGLQPGNGNSYFQKVPLVNIDAVADLTMQVKAPTGKFSLQALKDYVIWTDKTEQNISLENTPLIFAGYGVVAPEYNWNDYAGLDVKGKVVLVMVNDPGFWTKDSTLFKGRTMTYYGRWTYKFEEAARQGARGCLVIHRTSAAGYPFSVVQNSFNTSRLKLDSRAKETFNSDVIGWITDTAVSRLFTAAGYDTSLFTKANVRGFRAVDLKTAVTTSMRVRWQYNTSMNVMGKIEGAARPDELVIYMAHWDHLGIHQPDETGDSIYNGALDNATGTAGLIELARAFKGLSKRPERSILFLAVTAEEQGLLGSEYYTAHPVYPLQNTVAAINMDVLNNYGVTKDVQIVGLGQSELEDIMKDIVEEEGGYIVPETSPETGGYFRSDHFNFAKVGVPALYQGSGIDLVDSGKIYGQQLKDRYTAKHYHRPSDELDTATWNMDGALRDLRLFFKLGKRLAFSDRWPQWKQGSEFRAVRERDRRN